MVINQILFTVVFSIELFIFGVFICELFNTEKSLTLAFCMGFVAILSIFFVIATTVKTTGESLKFLACLFSIVTVVVNIIAVSVIKRRALLKIYMQHIRDALVEISKNKLIFAMLLGSIALHMFLTCCCYWYIDDDIYYIPREMEMISRNTLEVSKPISFMGYAQENWSTEADPATFSAFKAVLSYISGIHSAVLSKGVFGAILVLLSEASIWQLTRSVAEEKSHSFVVCELVLSLYTIFLCFAGSIVINDQAGMPLWQVRCIWEGKSVMVAIMFPLIMKFCVEIYNSGYDSKNIWKICLILSLVLLATASTTRVAIIFPPILCFILGVPYIISSVIKNKFNWILVPQIISALLPVMVIAAFTFWTAFGSEIVENIENTGDITSTIVKTYGSIGDGIWAFVYSFSFGHWMFFGMYVASLLYILFKGSITQKLVFIAAPAVLFITFLNPFLTNIVMHYVAPRSIYWRMYWLLPMWYVPPLVISLILVETENKIEFSSFCIGLAVSIFLCMYQESGNSITVRENPYSVSEEVKTISDYVLNEKKEKSVILNLCSGYPGIAEMRQYSIDIVMYGGVRDNQRSKNNYEGFKEVYASICNGVKVNEEKLSNVIEMGNVDYVITELSNSKLLQKLDYLEMVFSTENYSIWQADGCNSN